MDKIEADGLHRHERTCRFWTHEGWDDQGEVRRGIDKLVKDLREAREHQGRLADHQEMSTFEYSTYDPSESMTMTPDSSSQKAPFMSLDGASLGSSSQLYSLDLHTQIPRSAPVTKETLDELQAQIDSQDFGYDNTMYADDDELYRQYLDDLYYLSALDLAHKGELTQ